MALLRVEHFEESKSVLLKTIPVAQRVRGKGDAVTLKMRWCHANVLYSDPAATLNDFREAVAILEEIERPAIRVFGRSHPFIPHIQHHLRDARAALRARETPPGRQA